MEVIYELLMTGLKILVKGTSYPCRYVLQVGAIFIKYR